MLTAGIDIGSVATKALLLQDREILATAVVPTGSRPKLSAATALAQAMHACGLQTGAVQRTVSTGYGRRVVEFGDQTITEISACALGTVFWGSPRGRIRTIIDLGGQDIKVISLGTNDEVADFVMNDKCAAGTGRFLEVMARALEVPLEDLGPLAAKSEKVITVNATCTVFAESEVISLLAQEAAKEDIIAGIHRAIAERILAMTHKTGLLEIVAFNGGGAKNTGLCAALEAKLGLELAIPENPQLVNALGSALAAQRLG
ncbi:MAG: 2-hydroxyglutaryl-CoA dehydratase [Candidatus Firestonebacteria bacterium]|nr:2-hydroxyglutaryl-CoA dehydratase [Candidatus Firestonebacteria bacterium]